ncbi:MAG: MoxR family ATPase [bacterium]|nr:MoxR family ATPase [bacterium]
MITFTESAHTVLDAIDGCLFGERDAAEILMASYMAGGHTLINGVPGVGKTLLAKTFAATLGLDFARVQFTPDLMPADVTGVNIFDTSTGKFRLVRGPIFTQILMADEINRTPPKTQAALLEAMQERQVTIDGESQKLNELFTVIATQNPVEFEGTYPLPEAQLDRFLVRVEMRAPAPDAEVEMLRKAAEGTLVGWSTDQLPSPIVDPDVAKALRSASVSIHAESKVLEYLQRLAADVRQSPHVELGISPRGCLALLEMGRAFACLAGRDFLTPDDIKRALRPTWTHRLLLTPESELEGTTVLSVLTAATEKVEVPH